MAGNKVKRFCKYCGKQETKQRIVDVDFCCNSCLEAVTAEAEKINEDQRLFHTVNIADDQPLSDIKFGDFKNWTQVTIQATVEATCKQMSI